MQVCQICNVAQIQQRTEGQGGSSQNSRSNQGQSAAGTQRKILTVSSLDTPDENTRTDDKSAPAKLVYQRWVMLCRSSTKGKGQAARG